MGEVFFGAIFLRLVFNGQLLFSDGDTGFHIRLGEWILNHSRIPTEDFFSFITPPLKCHPHEWLSQVAMALVYRIGGLTALGLFFSFFIASFYATLFKILQKRFKTLASIVVLLLTIASSSFHWLARPHVFSWFFLIIVYFILEDYQTKGKNRLIFLPPLMLLWVNLHSGFVLGFMLLGVFFVGNLLYWFTWQGDESGRLFLEKIRNLGVIAFVCLVATLLNPEGYQALLFPLRSVADKTLMGSIEEFMPINFQELSVFKFYFLAVLALLVTSRKSLNLVELILFLVTTYLSFYSVRHVVIFLIVMLPILLKRLETLMEEGRGFFADYLRGLDGRITEVDKRAGGFVWALAAIAIVISLTFSGKIHFGFDKKKAPMEAIAFIREEKPSGHVFNADEFGDHLIYSLSPALKVFIDGRLADVYGGAILKEYLTVTGIRPGWDRVLAKYDIRWMVYYADAPLSLFMMAQKDWQLVYADKLAQIFVKRTPENLRLTQKYPNVQPVPRDMSLI